MKLPFERPGLSCFLFVALLLVFNWPLLSIPAPENLLGWLFTAWALAIALLFLAAQGASGKDAGTAQPAEPDGPGGQGAAEADADPAPRAGSGEGDGGV